MTATLSANAAAAAQADVAAKTADLAAANADLSDAEDLAASAQAAYVTAQDELAAARLDLEGAQSTLDGLNEGQRAMRWRRLTSLPPSRTWTPGRMPWMPRRRSSTFPMRRS